MSAHKLMLEIPDTLNKCVMRIVDLSVYDDNISVTCPRLQISVPGFKNSIFVDDIEPGFSKNFTACDLKIQSVKCGTEFNDLPDMLYVITWSVAPNNLVKVEYNVLRITKILNRIKAVLCKLDIGACEPEAALKAKLRELEEIQWYIMAAKAKVEDCAESKSGIALYQYASERLSKLEKILGCQI